MLLRFRVSARRSLALSFALILLFTLFFSTLTAQIARADASIVVNTIVDNEILDGKCSLREAIVAATTDANYNDCIAIGTYGTDTITFDAAVFNPGTITLGSNLQNITTNINFTGPGANLLTIDGANTYRVFITNSGTTVSISGMTITRGTTNIAGGAILSDSDVNVDGVAFISNSTTANGGGAIWVNNGTTTIINSTFSRNTTSGTGGAINVPTGGTLFLINSTMTGNSATDGGAIAASGPITLINSTISGNSATFLGGITTLNTSTFTNTIIANNAGGDCSTRVTITMQYSLIEDGSCGIVSGTNGNLTGDPGLGALASNGGPTQTMKLGANSPAINAGSDALAVDAGGTALQYDQRGIGYPRKVGTVDLGAFESSIVPTVVLSATKTVTPATTFEVGQTITYTVTISNSGTGAQADNAGHEFTDVLPAQLTLVSATASSGTAVSTVATNTVNWDGTLAATSGSVTITITATINSGVASGTGVSNQGTLSYDSNVDNSNDATASTDDPGVGGASDPTTFTVVAPAVSASKTASDLNGNNLVPGDTLEYTIVITNAGTANATSVMLSDAIPSNTTYVPNSTTLNTVAVADVAGVMPFVSGGSVGAIAASGGTATVVFDVTVNNPLPVGVTSISNQATVTGANFSSTPSNTPTSPVTTTPGLSLSKDDGVANVAPSGTITYTLSYDNTGNVALDNVTLTETVPDNTAFDAALSAPSVWSCADASAAGTVCTLNLGTLAGGTGADATFAVTVASTIPGGVTEIVNSASIASGATNASDDEHTPLTGVAPAVSASKTASDLNGGVLVPGDTLEYTITISNNGNTPAQNVVLTDAIPANTTYVPGTTTLNTVAVADIPTDIMPFVADGSIGEIAPGDSATVSFDVTVNNPLPDGISEIVNSGTVTGDNFDPITTNGAPLVSPIVSGLTIIKQFGTDILPIHATTTLRFTVINPAGNPALTGLSFSDVLPNGLVYDGTPVSPQCAGGVNLSNAFTLNFSGGTLDAGLSTCTIDVIVKSDGTVTGQVNNLSSVVSADGGILSASGASANLVIDAGPTPVPARFFECQNLGTQSGGALTSTGGIGAVHSGDVSGNIYCHIIGQDGHYVTDSAEIGIQSVLDLGVQQAVDVFGELPDGASVVPFDRPVQICLRGTGEVLFLNAAHAQRTVERLTAVDLNGYLCVQVSGSGTVVLVRQASGAAQLPAPATPAPQSVTLANCRITTTHAPLNLRAEPSSSAAVLAQLPYDLTLTATEHMPGWYRVIYLDGQGWISDSYVSTAGDCAQ